MKYSELIHKAKSTFLQVAIFIMILIGVPYVYGWSSPTGAPPTNNAPAPINVNAGYQIKSGDIGANTLYANAVNANSFFMPTSAGAGKVLSSDASGNGTWQTLSTIVGPTGPQGPVGATGATGPQGATGATGPTSQGTLCGAEYHTGGSFTTLATCQGWRPFHDGCPSGYSTTWLTIEQDAMTCVKL